MKEAYNIDPGIGWQLTEGPSYICGSPAQYRREPGGHRTQMLTRRVLDITPTHCRLHGQSGQVVEHALAVTNLGNAPVKLRNSAMVWLEERFCAARRQGESLRVRDNEENCGSGSGGASRLALVVPARILVEPMLESPLAPGQRVSRTLRLTLPSGLKAGRHYRGLIRIDDNRIWLDVYCRARA